MGSFRDMETTAAKPKGGTYRALDTAPARPKRTISQEISGAMATFSRNSIPGLDELNDGVNAWIATAADIATGKAKYEPVPGSWAQQPAYQANLARARANSKALSDQFVSDHRIGGNLTKGVGMAITAVPALATGGSTMAPGLFSAGRSAMPAAAEAAPGLMASLKSLGAATRNSAVTGGLTADIAGLASEGTAEERVQAGNDAIPWGAGLGAVFPGAAALGMRGVNAAARMFAPAAEKEAATAGRILASRAPEAVEPAPPADGELAYKRMGRGGRSLARAVANVPGPGQEIAERVLGERRSTAPARMLRTVQTELGESGDQFHPSLEALDQARLTNSKPLYAEAFEKGPVDSPTLQRLAQRPHVRAAIRRAYDLARNEDVNPEGLGLTDVEIPPGSVARAPVDEQLAKGLNALRSNTEFKLKQGPTLMEFMANNGGVNDLGGELRMRDAQLWHRKRPFLRKLIQENGDGMDGWSVRAWENGYFPERTSAPEPDELFQAIEAELAGKPRYAREVDPALRDQSDYVKALEERLFRQGIDPRAHSDHDIADLMEGRDPTVPGPPQYEPAFTTQPTAQTWDFVKRGLDDVIEEQRNPVTGRLPRNRDDIRQLDQTRRDLRRELVSQNPVYGEALNAYAGPSRQMDAMYLGRRLVTGKMDPEDINIGADKMSADELDGLRLGIARGLSDLFRGQRPQAAFRRFAEDQVVQDRLRAGFRDPAAYERFMADVRREVEHQGDFNDLFVGSRTTPLREDIDAANRAAGSDGIEIAADVMARRAGGERFRTQAIRAAVQNWERARQPGLNNPEVSRMLAEILFQSGDPERVLQAMLARQVISPAEVRAVLPYLAVGGGEISGQKTGTR